MSGETLTGTIRIGKDLKIYEYSKKGWKKTKQEFPQALKVISLFKAHNNFSNLIDQKNPKFLKGQLYEGIVQGARLNILPNGRKLDKAYSLLAKDLTIHDESSHDHWDVIYQNPNGLYAYLYTQEKKNKATKNKYKKVELFEKKYDLLEKNVIKALENKDDSYALPIYTLLKTCMRVGNETYYKHNGHKGLTTLKKKDLDIQKNNVQFNYIAKSGVPMSLAEEFPQNYIKRLKEKLNPLKNSDFIFADEQKHPLKDTFFMKAFQNYCGEKFYPHIVRSFYATEQTKKFIKSHKTATKQEVKELYTQIAEKLGHKRFDKKTSGWKDSFTVTIHHYIQPELIQKIEKLIN